MTHGSDVIVGFVLGSCAMSGALYARNAHVFHHRWCTENRNRDLVEKLAKNDEPEDSWRSEPLLESHATALFWWRRRPWWFRIFVQPPPVHVRYFDEYMAWRLPADDKQ